MVKPSERLSLMNFLRKWGDDRKRDATDDYCRPGLDCQFLRLPVRDDTRRCSVPMDVVRKRGKIDEALGPGAVREQMRRPASQHSRGRFVGERGVLNRERRISSACTCSAGSVRPTLAPF